MLTSGIGNPIRRIHLIGVLSNSTNTIALRPSAARRHTFVRRNMRNLMVRHAHERMGDYSRGGIISHGASDP